MVGDAARRKSFQEQLALMQQEYAARLPERIGQIADCWQALLRDPADIETAGALKRMAHTLAGSGLTFGLPAVTEAARLLENLIASITSPARKAVIGDSQNAQFVALLDVLRQAGTRPRLLAPSTQNYLPSELRNEFLAPPESLSWPLENHHLLLFLGREQQEADEGRNSENAAPHLVEQLQCFGHQTLICRSLAELREQLEKSWPSALLVRADVEELEALVQTLQPLQDGREAPLPLLFISERDDLETRLRAVRAGSVEFFVEPVDVSALSGKLHVLTARRKSSALRVLVVEDDAALSGLYAFILQQAGLIPEVARDGPETLARLRETTPDVILMDVQLPACCNGLELARAIRQMDAFAGVPFIFLSADAALPVQMTEMQLGGDLFLPQPVQPDRLVAATGAAAQRSRVLRSFMVRDSLTGLFNHTQFKEQLDIELARAQRASAALSLALIDLDNFQRVNEKYSHAQGDRVLRSVTRLLRQLVRKTDVVGRYDGDSFAVVLPEAGAGDAERVLDRIRQRCEQIRHPATEEPFQVTFSCGIATAAPDAGIPSNALLRAASDALLQAKQEGRNCIRLITALDV